MTYPVKGRFARESSHNLRVVPGFSGENPPAGLSVAAGIMGAHSVFAVRNAFSRGRYCEINLTAIAGVFKGNGSPAGPTARRWRWAVAAYLAAQSLQLWILLAMAPRFFWLDDSQRQFGPMAWWLGRNQLGGRPPLMDPDMGMAGNIVADMQYGALDPLHWIFQNVMARSDNLVLVSRVYGSLGVLILGTGVLWLARNYRVKPPLAVAGALGIASSGMFLWFGGSWWPLIWSIAWLPWLWVGLAGKGWPGVIVCGVATWAVLASGNPYAVPFALLIVLGQIWEYRRELGSFRALLQPWLIARMASCVGGVIVALPTLLTAVQMAPLMGREQADPLVGNAGFAVANLADVLLGGMTLLGQTNAWAGSIGLSPSMATMLLALPLLALVNWAKALDAPGVRTALLVVFAAAIFTQLPTTVSVFRNPLRHLAAFQITVPVLALITVSAAPDLSRRRIKLAGLILAAQFVIALFRAPVFAGWHLFGLALGVIAGMAALGLLTGRPGRTGLASAVLILGVGLSPLVGERMMVALNRRIETQAPATVAGGRPFREIYPGYQLGETVGRYRDRSYAVDETMTVMRWGPPDPDEGWKSGVLTGNGNLIAGFEPGFGSLAVFQARLNRNLCRDWRGSVCSSPAQLLATVPGTDRPWVDVVSSDIVVLSGSAPPEVRQYFDATWTKSLENERWVEYQRRVRLPGRITVADGVKVSEQGWTAGPAYIGRPMESYTVSTGARPGTLIFRTPYWPGLKATLGGAATPVSSVDRSLVRIELPAGLPESRLEIFFDPIGAGISTPATVAGLAIIAASALAVARQRRRHDRQAARSSEAAGAGGADRQVQPALPGT